LPNDFFSSEPDLSPQRKDEMSSGTSGKPSDIVNDLILQKVMAGMPPSRPAGTGESPARTVGRVSSEISRSERWQHLKCRIGGFRDKYIVSPGLYAFGDPGIDDDVLVSANYKLSFDVLRSELGGHNFWILVLDTKGINVWCAAGKGTFGTGELIRRIADARLDNVVSHRRLILPQLGAVGVNAAEVRKRTGFKVKFGPVLASDIPAYMNAGYKKTKEMSTIHFSILDRLMLTPMEINPFMKKYLWFAAGVLVLFGLQREGVLFSSAWNGGLPFLLLGLVTLVAGAFITPVLLPYIPFRSFAIKGLLAGLAAIYLATLAPVIADSQDNVLLRVVTFLLFPAASSYIALQFTGSTTYTGMSGVKRELKIGMPLYMGAAAISLLLLIVFKLKEWGIV
jgi:acetyl-CoA decarbonylase/synthase complex subunit gamma